MEQYEGAKTTADSISEGRMKEDVSGMKRKKKKVLKKILKKNY